MPMPRDSDATAPAPRWLFGIAGTLIALYVLNVGLRIAFVKFGAAPWRLNDVGEFLLVLLSMVFFVAALIVDEERQGAAGDGEVDSNPTQGGVR